jgi:acetyltransferase
MAEDLHYPAELTDVFTLSDQTRIRVRPLHRFEDGPIRELFDHLSLRTRYLRFFSPLRVLPDSMVSRLASVDYRRNLALVAERESGDCREVVGLGSFGAVDDEQVEVALVIRDDWQQRRIGTELAIRILAAAEARGFHRFIANVTSDNRPIRKLLKNLGDVVSATASAGISELVFVRRHSIEIPGGIAQVRRHDH